MSPDDPALAVPVAAPLAAAQHRAALWADDGVQVFAVVMGTSIPDLPARLAEALVADYDCLLPGALAPTVARDAPYLVALRPDSPFTDWLLFEAAATLAGWGVLVRSPARLLVLRNHLRGLLQAQLPGGRRIALDWMDPVILDALLPLFESAELASFFGPVQSFTVAGAKAWEHADYAQGRLARRRVPLAGVA